jgi:hypothetical protein
MQKNKLLLIVLFVGFISNTTGQQLVKVTGTASARLISATSINVDKAMGVEGLLVSSTEAATLKLSPTDSDREFSNQSLVSESNGNNNIHVTSIFTIKGEPNVNYKVSLPDDSIEISTTATGSNKTMSVNNFTLRMDNTEVASDLTQQLSNNGITEFTIKATLNVEDLQTMGNYTGRYHMGINYE